MSAANHAGACSSRDGSAPATGGRKGSRAPAASFTTIRTWRTSRNCEVRSARNFSAGTSCRISPTASRTRSCASSIEAAISTRVDVRAWKIVTAPATSAAITSITTKTMSNCVRTERPCHKTCAARFGHAGGASNGVGVSDGARMNVLPQTTATPRVGPWDGAPGNGR